MGLSESCGGNMAKKRKAPAIYFVNAQLRLSIQQIISAAWLEPVDILWALVRMVLVLAVMTGLQALRNC
jgi:hypothetical protein